MLNRVLGKVKIKTAKKLIAALILAALVGLGIEKNIAERVSDTAAEIIVDQASE